MTIGLAVRRNVETNARRLGQRIADWWLARGQLKQLIPWCLAQLYLRHCTRIGKRVRTYGRPVVDNAGTMVLGDRVRVVSRISPTELITFPGARLEIGDGVFINRGTVISACHLVKIGRNCLIGTHCTIMDGDLHDAQSHRHEAAGQAVTIEDGVWLGTRVIVLKGVTIGRGSTVGAGSVVTRNIPPLCVAAGVPARVIKRVPGDRREGPDVI